MFTERGERPSQECADADRRILDHIELRHLVERKPLHRRTLLRLEVGRFNSPADGMKETPSRGSGPDSTTSAA